MSYILDALRRADAERERNPARGIHAQPIAPASGPGFPAAKPTWWLGAAVVAAAVLGVVAWQLRAPRPPAVLPEAGTAEMAPPAPAATVASVAPPAPVQPPAASVVLPPAPPVIARERPAQQRGQGQDVERRAVRAPTPAAAPPAVADKILAASEMPADLRRDLPKLVLSGGVYSDNPAQRMLIVNGQVMGEGAEPVPGLVLEQIRARAAVFSYRGHRFLQGF